MPSLRVLAQRPDQLTVAALLIAALIAFPVFGVVLQVFAPGSENWVHVRTYLLPDYLTNTLWLAVGTLIGVVILGTASAWLVTACNFPGRAVFEWALILPLAAPAYVIAYAYTDLLQHPGPVQTGLRALLDLGPRDYWFPEIRSLGGAVFVFSVVLFPYVYLLARAAFLEQAAGVLEASRSLGESPWRGFARVALPLARPAIVAGAALAMMEMLADFGAVSHFGVETFTTGIYRAWLSMGDRALAGKLAAMLLLAVLVVLLIERWSRRHVRVDPSEGRFRAPPRFILGPVARWGAFAACLAPIALGFLVPVGYLSYLAITAGHDPFTEKYLTLVWNTLSLAGITAGLAVVIALVLAYAARLRRTPLVRGAVRVAALGYAVPGSIIAVAILIPLATLDQWLGDALEGVLGWQTGLILTGSLAALVYAYLVRFMALPIQALEAGLERITPNIDAAARSLGAGPPRTLATVHLPMLRASVLSAGVLTFVEVMKELPATLIARPFNFDTLAVQAYRLASDERLAEASTASLTIVAVGLIPVILLSRAITRSASR